MSQEVGFQYKSRIPVLSDDASIVEALKVYHYGVDNYSTEPIPDDSIEGNFRTLSTAVASLESSVSGLGTTYVEQISLTASPNIITGQSTTTVPLTVRSIAAQTAALLQLQNSSSVNVGSVSTGGNMNLAGYLTVGTTTQATTVGLNILVGNAAHNGIVVKAQASQTANIQEWQNSGGTAIAFVDKDGKVFSSGIETVNLSSNQTLTNKTLSTPISTIGTNARVASYALALSDQSKIVEMNSSSNMILDVLFDSQVNFPVGAYIVILQTGSGKIEVAGAVSNNGSVQINATPGKTTRTQWSMATLIKRAANSWVLSGDLIV